MITKIHVTHFRYKLLKGVYILPILNNIVNLAMSYSINIVDHSYLNSLTRTVSAGLSMNEIFKYNGRSRT